MASIRRATHEDHGALLHIAEEMHRESPRYGRYPLDGGRLSDLAAWLIDNPAGFVVVAEHEARVVGTLWGYANEMFFSSVRVCSDLLVYIHPDYRGGLLAARLVWAFEQWARDMGAAEVQFGVSADITNDTALRLYTGLGYTTTGTVVAKNV